MKCFFRSGRLALSLRKEKSLSIKIEFRFKNIYDKEKYKIFIVIFIDLDYKIQKLTNQSIRNPLQFLINKGNQKLNLV